MLDHLPVVLTLVAFGLHVAGERRAAVLTGRPRGRRARARARTFYAGLAVIVVALQSPLDALAEKLFWAHMIQHLLLLVVAAPLIVLGRPWMSLWRPLPLGLRRRVARALVRSRAAAPLRGLVGVLSRPAGAWIAFSGTMVMWHAPVLYDLTLRNSGVHILEHTLFVVLAIPFWAQVAGCPPARSPLPYLKRCGYTAAAIVPNIGLSMVLAYSSHPLYAPYAHLLARPGAITALADQQIGAGIMWAAGDMPFVIAIAWLAQRWLAAVDGAAARVAALVPAPVEPDPRRTV